MFNPSAQLTWAVAEALIGARSVKIHAPTPNGARWIADVSVQPDTLYGLSGWIKTENVAGTTTGTAWFDGLRLTPVVPSTPAPFWKIQTLIYDTTDVTFTDAGGVMHHVIARMTPTEQMRAAQVATRFVTHDIPVLNSRSMTPTLTIQYPNHPLTQLTRDNGGWWPAPADTLADRDPTADSVIVIWDPRRIDQATHESILLNSYGGLTPSMGGGQTYQRWLSFQVEMITGICSNTSGAIQFSFISKPSACLPSRRSPIILTAHSMCIVQPARRTSWKTRRIITRFQTQSTIMRPSLRTIITPARPPHRISRRAVSVFRRLPGPSAGRSAIHPIIHPYYHQLHLRPTNAERSGAPGSGVRHTLTLTNTGNLTDTFTLILGAHGWPVDAPESIADLGPGQAADVSIIVTVPLGALADATDQITLTVVSTADPAQQAVTTLTTRAARRYALTLTTMNTEQTAAPGTPVHYTLTLTNSGNNITDSFKIIPGAHAWPTNAPAQVADLAPGEQAQIMVTVGIPADAARGASDTVTFVAVSQGQPSTTAAITLTTRTPASPPTYTLLLPLVRR
jgi:hypothetical protein